MLRNRKARGAALATMAMLSGVTLTGPAAGSSDPITFAMAGRYTTGLADPATERTAAEIAAYARNQMYVVNSPSSSEAGDTLNVVDVVNPGAPTLLPS